MNTEHECDTITVPLVHSGKHSGVIATARKSGEPGCFEEIAVTMKRNGVAIADVLITTDPATGELRIYASTDGDADEHTFTIWPERPQHQAFERLK